MVQRFKRGFALALVPWSLGLGCLSGVSQAQGPQAKVLAGFFEEWSIYSANYNIADLQANGVASHMSHFIYAFGNVTSSPTAPSCAIADAWADFETPYLPLPAEFPASGRCSATSLRY